ncbi:type II toxin-antitoxin system VapC family toxin [Aerosakkonemataceae cyanobacterium BLCC-F50]|uniref:Type II toxin-antitoxin system VapC family toxin n=1 Tax=Floridaenema flaviceps BLCC-F50 TaxID=3153642 RepID=A0ABV4Y4S9_9CYAN
MNVLLDTHTFIWYIEGSLQLSRQARDIIGVSDNNLYFSIASLWEIAIKVGKGRLVLQNSFDELVDVLKFLEVEVLPITLADVQGYLTLPLHHSDPFDRMLITQAINHSLIIVGCDVAFDAYPIQRLWL